MSLVYCWNSISSTNQVSDNTFGQRALNLLDIVLLTVVRALQTDIAFDK